MRISHECYSLRFINLERDIHTQARHLDQIDCTFGTLDGSVVGAHKAAAEALPKRGEIDVALYNVFSLGGTNAWLLGRT